VHRPDGVLMHPASGTCYVIACLERAGSHGGYAGAPRRALSTLRARGGLLRSTRSGSWQSGRDCERKHLFRACNDLVKSKRHPLHPHPFRALFHHTSRAQGMSTCKPKPTAPGPPCSPGLITHRPDREVHPTWRQWAFQVDSGGGFESTRGYYNGKSPHRSMGSGAGKEEDGTE